MDRYTIENYSGTAYEAFKDFYKDYPNAYFVTFIDASESSKFIFYVANKRYYVSKYLDNRAINIIDEIRKGKDLSETLNPNMESCGYMDFEYVKSLNDIYDTLYDYFNATVRDLILKKKSEHNDAFDALYYSYRCIEKGFDNYMTPPTLVIDHVIYNDPATIVFWNDGTKTIVKAQDCEYDPDKGLAMAIVKKTLGLKEFMKHSICD